MEELQKLTLLDCVENVQYELKVTQEIFDRAKSGKFAIVYINISKVEAYFVFIIIFRYYFADTMFATKLLQFCINKGKNMKLIKI